LEAYDMITQAILTYLTDFKITIRYCCGINVLQIVTLRMLE